MKKLFGLMMILIASMFVVACGGGSSSSTDSDAVTDSPVINDTDNSAVDQTDTATDSDKVVADTTEETPDTDNVTPKKCTLPDYSKDATDDSFIAVKQVGEINDYADQQNAKKALITAGKLVLKEAGMTKTLDFGMFFNYQGSVLLVDNSAYTWVGGQPSGDGTYQVRLWDYMAQLNAQAIPQIKQQYNGQDIDAAPSVFGRDNLLDIVVSGGQVTGQTLRKVCWQAISATKKVDDGNGNKIDASIGKMFFCLTDKNTDGSAGETLKMSYYNKLTEDTSKISTYINTQQDGSVKKEGDLGYQKICTCYNENGPTNNFKPTADQPKDPNEVPCDGAVTDGDTTDVDNTPATDVDNAPATDADNTTVDNTPATDEDTVVSDSDSATTDSTPVD